ncbi:MAG: ABC transporter permease [Deltaproteobacteria bacterium]
MPEEPLLQVRDLTVALPGGDVVVSHADLDLAAGEVVALVGPSGAGKTTILRAILYPEDLREAGYTVTTARRVIEAPFAIVPQRGALFDHLDVAGNIEIAQLANARDPAPGKWLEAVELGPDLAKRGRSVAALSGGQAQRVAVARTLAAGRRILVLDEPSVGLDPLGVRNLARLLARQAREQRIGILLVTHDLALAGGASDRILFLDSSAKTLKALPAGEDAGPAELLEEPQRRRAISDLERRVEALLLDTRGAPSLTAKQPREPTLGALRVAGGALVTALHPRLLGPSFRVLWRATSQSMFRPMPFYVVVGLLLGATVPYVIAHISDDLRPAAVLRLVGGTYVLALAPALSAILFAATSGSAVNAWLGGLQLHRQMQAMEGLGIPAARYIWSPTWCALVIAYLVVAAVFAASMLVGGWALFDFYGVPHALAVVTSDFVHPPGHRMPYLVRGGWLVTAYAFLLASIAVARGASHKNSSEQVTRAMTTSVIQSTLWVVVLELATIALTFWLTGKHA